MIGSSKRLSRSRRVCATLLVLGFVAAACSSDSKSSSSTDAAGTKPAGTEKPADTSSASSAPASTAPASTAPASAKVDPAADFPSMKPPTGTPIVLGLVNTEGTPGLDFPEMRIDTAALADYLNQHGGMGGRPIKIENCTVDGSPEKSQACAQELVGKKVDMVTLGLDLFPDYATYTAANIPVVGVLPILPTDNTANALFLTGGNATTMAAAANVAKNHFNAKTVGIVSADNAGANSTEASLTAALDKAGIAHTTVKGGDNETDAGYQGLMREAAKDNPDVLVSLYSDAGCIGTMRGRAALGITIPVITTGICSGSDVIKQVGDDAVGWNFIGVATQEPTPGLKVIQDVMGPVKGVDPSQVDTTGLGLGGLALFQLGSLATYANKMAAEGTAVTGPALYDYLSKTKGLTLWPGDGKIDCGAAAPKYPSFCTFTFPFAEYKAGGKVETIPGLEAVSALDYLP
jgi:hypothetical protein